MRSGAVHDLYSPLEIAKAGVPFALSSWRAPVEATALGPRGESTFAVTAPRVGDVVRYRVSFRTEVKLVPHLDRRHES